MSHAALTHKQVYAPIMGNSQSPLKALQDTFLATSSKGTLKVALAQEAQSSATWDASGTVAPRVLTYAYASHRGTKTPLNQDCLLIRPAFLDRPELALFGIFDGHGSEGAKLSTVIRDHVEMALGRHLKGLMNRFPNLCADEPVVAEGIVNALSSAFIVAHQLVESDDAGQDEAYSGACVLLVLFVGPRVFCANAGTSRAVLARYPPNAPDAVHYQAASMSSIHTPARADEKERLLAHGGRVLSYSQMERVRAGEVVAEDEERNGDPLRVYDGTQGKPGCLFTRSIGDSYAKRLGVCADPEVCTHHVAWGQDLVISLGSHGVFDLLDGPSLASVLEQCPTPFDACKAVGDHCIKQHKADGRGDDSSFICIYLHDAIAAQTASTQAEQEAKNNHTKGKGESGKETLVAKAT